MTLDESFSSYLCLTEEYNENEREAVKNKNKKQTNKKPVTICMYFSGVNQDFFFKTKQKRKKQ